MKKFLLICFLAACSFYSSAQVSLELGSGAQLYNFTGRVQTGYGFQDIDETQLMFNVVFGGNVPYKFIKDEVVVGFNPNVSVGLQASSISIDVPVFATLKIGAGSSDKAESTLGVGIGAGGVFSYFSTFLNYQRLPVRYSSVYVLPMIMGEASLNASGYANYQLRFEYTPVPVDKFTETFVGNISQFNIRLIRTL